MENESNNNSNNFFIGANRIMEAKTKRINFSKFNCCNILSDWKIFIKEVSTNGNNNCKECS